MVIKDEGKKNYMEVTNCTSQSGQSPHIAVVYSLSRKPARVVGTLSNVEINHFCNKQHAM